MIYKVLGTFGKGAYEEAARAKNDGIEIRLVTVEELLNGMKKLVQ